MRLKSLVSHTITMPSRHLHTSIGIPLGPIALPSFILFKAFLKTLESFVQNACWHHQRSCPAQWKNFHLLY
uniref:Uncharacterized protein n=1 Tax=Arundo donax TaxID=35708 RepID=A0A0A9FWZ3_ARUDO